MARALRAFTLLAAIAAVTGCNVKDTKVPPVSGPSELGLSLTLQATPDILTQDGSSQSQVIVLARDGNGQPVRNVSCRIDIIVDGEVADFGTLSNRTVTTGSDGRAAVVYTAPGASPVSSTESTIMLAVTPIGNDFANETSRVVSIRLVPTGVIDVPTGAWFTVTPSVPAVAQNVVLDGSASTAPSGRRIVAFDWTFGDGEGKHTTLPFTSHDWATAGSFMVTLTITDEAGQKSTKMVVLTVVEKS